MPRHSVGFYPRVIARYFQGRKKINVLIFAHSRELSQNFIRPVFLTCRNPFLFVWWTWYKNLFQFSSGQLTAKCSSKTWTFKIRLASDRQFSAENSPAPESYHKVRAFFYNVPVIWTRVFLHVVMADNLEEKEASSPPMKKPRFLDVSEAAVSEACAASVPANLKFATALWLRVFSTFWEETGTTIELRSCCPKDLNQVLCRFYVALRNKNGGY